MNEQCCPNCKSNQPATATWCLNCGESLDTTLTFKDQNLRQQLLKAAKAQSLQLTEITIRGVSSPDEQKHRPAAQPTRPLTLDEHPDGEIRFGTMRLDSDLVLTELETGTQFLIPRQNSGAVMVGRSDRASGFTPAIDLNNLYHLGLGVSRRHALIKWRDNILVLIDQNSTNGTFINGKQLVPEQARILRNNDEIAFGPVKFKITYQKKANNGLLGIPQSVGKRGG